MPDKAPPVTASLGFGITPSPKAGPAPPRKPRILLVDPDPASRRFMNARLASVGYQVDCADGSQAALDSCIRSRPNLVISDLRLDHMDGLDLLRELKSRWPALTVVIVTAHATIAEAVRATQSGAFGFLVKPVERGELLGQVERAIDSSNFAPIESDWRSEILTRSRLMEERLELANQAARGGAPVLLTGENGTGKELLARAIHAASSRREQPFVAARFRDAPAIAMGAVGAAGGGTLLLDEVGCLPMRMQAELMAALRGAAARLITTTSRDLKQSMEAGEFRQDLYYHVGVLTIEIPPLGRRREDIPLLVSHFLEQATLHGGEKLYSPDAIELLATTDWPGNVRQLFDVVKQNVALSHGKIISREFVQQSLGKPAKQVPTYVEARTAFARHYLSDNLQATAGNVSKSARLAKRNRTDFYKLLARYRVAPDDFKRGPGDAMEQDGGDTREPD